jgi:mono/diheme cytochrome c family protein
MSDNQDQHNQGGMIAFIFSMVFVLVFFIYIVAIHPGVDLNENIQTPVVQTAAPVLTDVDISKVTEPWVANADMAKHGAVVFKANCAICHGNEGKGDGPGGAALNPKPRNLVEGPWKKGGGYIGWFTVLQNGLEGTAMVSWKHLKKEDRWALVQFIDSITKAKVKEDPAKVAEFAKTAE